MPARKSRAAGKRSLEGGVEFQEAIAENLDTGIVQAGRPETAVRHAGLEAYFSRYGDIADALGILEQHSPNLAPEDENKVRKVGDWFSSIAGMADHGLVDKQMLLDGFGFRGPVNEFCDALRSSPLNHLLGESGQG